MLNVAIVGASGYTGAVLCSLLADHPKTQITGLYVSENSQDQGKKISQLHGSLAHRCDLPLKPLTDPKALGSSVDAVFLCTDHKVSHDIAKDFISQGARVFDLSGAFRVNDPMFYEQYYGFKHEHQDLLHKAIYALCEFVNQKDLKECPLISLPGCYPTVSQLSLRPLIEAKLLNLNFCPIINAVSGVSGAGRGLKLNSHFCEVSTNAYGIFCHRHQPEITAHLNTEVIFNPHLGNFKRGILATITAKLRDNVTTSDITKAYLNAYENKSLVRLKDVPSAVKDVEFTPFCDIFFKDDGKYIVISSAIDNLMKGASSQAVQAFNLTYDFSETLGLL